MLWRAVEFIGVRFSQGNLLPSVLNAVRYAVSSLHLLALLGSHEFPYPLSQDFADQLRAVDASLHSQAGISLLEDLPLKAGQVACVSDLVSACLYFALRMEGWARVLACFSRSARSGWYC